MYQQTSLLAHIDLDINRCRNVRDKILNILKNHPNGLTDRELCLNFTDYEVQNWQPKARRNELTYGLKDRHGNWIVGPHQIITRSKRKCSVTNRTVCVWEINIHQTHSLSQDGGKQNARRSFSPGVGSAARRQRN